MNDLNVRLSGFYLEMLKWWAQFRNTLSDFNYSRYIIWNNKDIRIANKSVFYKACFDNGIFHLIDLQFDQDNEFL